MQVSNKQIGLAIAGIIIVTLAVAQLLSSLFGKSNSSAEKVLYEELMQQYEERIAEKEEHKQELIVAHDREIRLYMETAIKVSIFLAELAKSKPVYQKIKQQIDEIPNRINDLRGKPDSIRKEFELFKDDN